MDKLDFKKRDKPLYTGKPGRWDDIDVPEMQFLMIDGQGDPNGPNYARALSALYPMAYTMKFAAKAAGADFVVPPLEALWWSDDPAAFVRNDRSAWRWTALLRMPDDLGDDDLEQARESCTAKLAKKGAEAVPVLNDIRLAASTEGRSLQTLHVGPYTAEAATLADLHERLMPEKGLTFNGPHHEIYLSDPGRVAPEKLKTILRQPVRPR